MANEETETRRRAYLEAMGIQHWEETAMGDARALGPTRPTTEAVAPVPRQTMQQATPEVTQQAPLAPTNTAPVSPPDIGISAPTEPHETPLSPPRVAATAVAPQPPPRPVEPPSLGWPELEQAVRACSACDLHRTRTQTVFGIGNRQADWMLIGEAPGADEDRLGEPFVGRAGKLLDAMLQAIGLQRQQVYIGNILKCRPPRNRDPENAEIDRCKPFLDRQIELIQPRLILTLGRIASQTLLQTTAAMRDLRGRPHHYQGIPVIVTYHPAYLLRSPREKRKVWQDLQSACREMAKQQ